jgi:hypothetical protein
MGSSETPRKVDASVVEVVGRNGEVIQEGEQGQGPRIHSFQGIKVFKGGPVALLLLPVLIPLVLFFFLLAMVFALVFGRGVFKVFSTGLKRRS